MKTFFVSFCLFTQILSVFCDQKQTPLDTFFGIDPNPDKLIIDLINSKTMQRIKKIDQSGISYYFNMTPKFTRYDHSVGVYYLLKRFGASLKEQAAGLLHDASHTAFSHLGDLIFDHDETVLIDSYQDKIHDWFLKKSDISKVLENHQFTIEDLLHKSGEFKALEQPLPDLCADRLQYNLHTGYLFKKISKEDVEKILNDLSFENGVWFFKTPSIAKKFGMLSLYFTETFWGSFENLAVCHISAKAFKLALKKKLIEIDDIHFGSDEAVLEKVLKGEDKEILTFFEKARNYSNHAKLGHRNFYSLHIRPKFRGINPLVKLDNQFMRLTSLDAEYSREYARIKKLMNKGHYLKLDS